MKRATLSAFLLSSVCLAHAQAAPDAAAPLSKKDATELLQGATVAFTSNRGNQLSWKNEPAGTMLASSSGSRGKVTTQSGTWKVDDKGRFCVSIDWPSNLEEWCRGVIKDGDTFYLTRSNGGRVSKLVVTR